SWKAAEKEEEIKDKQLRSLIKQTLILSLSSLWMVDAWMKKKDWEIVEKKKEKGPDHVCLVCQSEPFSLVFINDLQHRLCWECVEEETIIRVERDSTIEELAQIYDGFSVEEEEEEE
ncbi:hypothetical protein PFISCL1PPCAC_1839, partial [Pristionchus fissidentatus]